MRYVEKDQNNLKLFQYNWNYINYGDQGKHFWNNFRIVWTSLPFLTKSNMKQKVINIADKI